MPYEDLMNPILKYLVNGTATVIVNFQVLKSETVLAKQTTTKPVMVIGNGSKWLSDSVLTDLIIVVGTV